MPSASVVQVSARPASVSSAHTAEAAAANVAAAGRRPGGHQRAEGTEECVGLSSRGARGRRSRHVERKVQAGAAARRAAAFGAAADRRTAGASES